MSDASCKTCPFSRQTSGRGGTEFKCQRGPRPPGDAGFPSVLSTEWCGEHPLRQRDRLAAMAM